MKLHACSFTTVSGLPYEHYLSEHLFAPLAMDRTTFDLSQAVRLGVAQGYVRRNDALEPGTTPFTRSAVPAGILASTARDVGNHRIALLHGGSFGGKPLIDSTSLAELFKGNPFAVKVAACPDRCH